MTRRCGSGVEHMLGLRPSRVRLPSRTRAGGETRVFASSDLIDVMLSSMIEKFRALQAIDISMISSEPGVSAC